eukprot:2864059-Prymnesium_polylepis.1
MGIMFFPVGGVQESALGPTLLVGARVPHNATEHTSVSAYSVTNDSAVQRAVSGLRRIGSGAAGLRAI